VNSSKQLHVTADKRPLEEAEKQAKRPVTASVVRGILVLLTLALALWVSSFALGQAKHREFSNRPLTFPRSALDRQQPSNRQAEVTPDSVKDRHQVLKQAEPSPASAFQGIPRGIDCDNAPGIVIHDDGTVENGYGNTQGIMGIWADKFTPTSYPSIYASVCLSFNRLCAAPTSEGMEVVVFDDDGPGGSPGTELGAMPVTITNIPLFPDPTPVWNSFDISSLNIVVNDGGVYIGARWTPQNFFDRVYLSSDENGPGSGSGYWFDSFNNVWAPIQNFFPRYRAMFVRAVEQPADGAVVNTDSAVGGVVLARSAGSIVDARDVQPETLDGCPSQYVIAQGTDRIVPGNTDTGNHCDGCDTFVPLPFNFQLYGITYNGVNVSDNGRLDFVNINEPGGYITACLPAPPGYFTGLPYDNTIFALWQDHVTLATSDGCASFPGGTCGVFTSVTGSAPNRIFNIEWRTTLYWDDAAPQNFEVRLYENDPNERFDVIIGTLTPATFPPVDPRPWVSGVQGDNNLGLATEDFCICWPDSPPQNQSRTYMLTPCATPTPTPTPSPTPTPTATATSTPRPTPTPRGSPIPRPRPSPHPRP
jgi:hypothetical protein